MWRFEWHIFLRKAARCVVWLLCAGVQMPGHFVAVDRSCFCIELLFEFVCAGDALVGAGNRLSSVFVALRRSQMHSQTPWEKLPR